MISENRKIQIQVGIFVLIGLTTVGIMVVYFGRMSEGMRHHYRLNIHFTNASGLKKGADVLLSGARIGRVAASPSILPDMQGVNVPLLIYNGISIPNGSRFTIGSSGLLGDRFVDILVKREMTNARPILPGTILHGEYASGVEDMVSTVDSVAKQTSKFIAHLDVIVQDIGQVSRRVRANNMLQPESLKNLSETFANLREISSNLTRLSKRMERILCSADVAIEESRKTLLSVRSITQEISQALKNEKNTLGLFLTDKEIANNIRALILNMRKHGILWYKDTQLPAQTQTTHHSVKKGRSVNQCRPTADRTRSMTSVATVRAQVAPVQRSWSIMSG